MILLKKHGYGRVQLVSEVLHYIDTQENVYNKSVYASCTSPFIECT